MSKTSSFILYLLLISTIITLDQITKSWAIANLSGKNDLILTNWCNLSLITNRGISWGVLNFQSNIGFFTLTTLILCLILAFAFYTIIQHLNRMPIYFESLVLGGAISNIIDRITQGYVIDFIDLHLGAWHWPTFNIADVFVVIGIIGIFLKSMYKRV